ncbi:transcription factor dp-1 [Stylonychia lemnae]|uniref:Transcription factor dp-1 n=1 Tax=Stylonychia lemnae TaxID=5949 RepID=A0A077ZYV8_STYLE|nr:transcription factor dp-1 [Stylonychia lemnae]|eukprot:CDW74327.1 transcription factor dp-1 [Stylonychia lemnae]
MYDSAGTMGMGSNLSLPIKQIDQSGETKINSKSKRQSSSQHPFHQKTFKENELFKAANLYNLLDKHQHLYENRIFAQSSINQIKLAKESQKFKILMDDNDQPQFIKNSSIMNSQRPITTTGLGGYQSSASMMNSQTVMRPVSQQTLQSIVTNKNASQDFDLDKITQNQQIFKRYLSTVDPQMFKSQMNVKGQQQIPTIQEVNDYVSTAQEFSKHSMYFSNRSKQAAKGDKINDFYNMARDLNYEGKQRYYASQLQKNEITNTVRQPTEHITGNSFDQCKIQKKAYRANSESQTIYKEKTREKKSLINFQVQPFDMINLRDEANKLASRRPMTTITAGQCQKVYGISDFAHLSRITAPNHNEDYQRAVTTNQKLFRRQNGPFTEWFNSLKTQKFISVPFQSNVGRAAGIPSNLIQKYASNNLLFYAQGEQHVNTNYNDRQDISFKKKEKSLGELCRRFLFLYGGEARDLLYLDQCTKELAVERRRIYDIINILESFNVIRRKAKNAYQWKGIEKILKSISLQISFFESKLDTNNSKICQLQEKNKKSAKSAPNSNRNLKVQQIGLCQDESRLQKMINSHQGLENITKKGVLLDEGEISEEEKENGAKYKKDKSLGILCQQFIGLFVSWKDIISLEEAARQISKIDIEEQKLKTKIRRLYDIANVLQSIGLIQKTSYPSSKKPAFQWVGIQGVQDFVNELKEHEISKLALNPLSDSDASPDIKIRLNPKYPNTTGNQLISPEILKSNQKISNQTTEHSGLTGQKRNHSDLLSQTQRFERKYSEPLIPSKRQMKTYDQICSENISRNPDNFEQILEQALQTRTQQTGFRPLNQLNQNNKFQQSSLQTSKTKKYLPQQQQLPYQDKENQEPNQLGLIKYKSDNNNIKQLQGLNFQSTSSSFTKTTANSISIAGDNSVKSSMSNKVSTISVSSQSAPVQNGLSLLFAAIDIVLKDQNLNESF